MLDELGDRLKKIENIESKRRVQSSHPIYARIDGRSFSNFTLGMRKPFDEVMSRLMIDTAKELVDKTHATIGYVQSDEISLLFHTVDDKSQLIFGGRILKMASVLASLTTAIFTAKLHESPTHSCYASKLPHFDARIVELTDREMATEAFLWRTKDAERNAVSMAARAHFSHAALQHKSVRDMLSMMADKGVRFSDYPAHFRCGTFVRSRTREAVMPDREWSRIPEKHRPPRDQLVRRSFIDEINLSDGGLSSLENRVGFLFDDQPPVLRNLQQAQILECVE